MTLRITVAVAAVILVVGSAIAFPIAWGSLVACFTIAGTFTAGAACALVYFRLSWSEYTGDDIGDRAIVSPRGKATIDAVIRNVDAFGMMSTETAVRFLIMVAYPETAFDRMSDSATATTRSLKVKTTASLKVAGHEGEIVIVPLLMRYRGVLEDGMSFFIGSETRVSSLTHAETTAFCLAVVRTVVRSWKEESQYRQFIERRLAKFLNSEQLLSSESFDEITDQIIALAPAGSADVFTSGLEQYLTLLQSRQPICVPVPLLGLSADAEKLSSSEGASGTSRPGRIFPLRIVANHRTVVGFNFRRETDARPGEPSRGWVDRIRRLFGIRPSLISVPLVNAGRAASYHLEVVGPEGTYLARQRTVRRTTHDGEIVIRDDAIPAHVVAQPRSGQRHAHLYVRGAAKTETYLFTSQFYERMPGSMAPAFVSALSVAVLVWLALFAVGPNKNPLFENWEYAALVLAFPSAITLWLGLNSERRLSEGVLAARVSTLITVFLATAAAWMSVVAAVEVDKRIWFGLALVATVNAIAPFISWMMRAQLQSRFVERSLTPTGDDLALEDRAKRRGGPL